MTYAPATIAAVGALWEAAGGLNDGIVGNTAHTYGYHLGRDRIYTIPPGLGDQDYSVRQSARDRAGLSDAASAIDLAPAAGLSIAQLRRLTRWLWDACIAGDPDTADLREVIGSEDGVTVYGWNALGVRSALVAGYGDLSHLGHTHLSWFRDAEGRDHTAILRRGLAEVGIMGPTLGFAPVGDQPAPGSTVDLLAGRDLLSPSDPRPAPEGLRFGPYAAGLTGLAVVAVGEFRRISDSAQADVDGNIPPADGSRVAVYLVNGAVNGVPFGVLAAALVADCGPLAAPAPSAPAVDEAAIRADQRAKDRAEVGTHFLP